MYLLAAGRLKRSRHSTMELPNGLKSCDFSGHPSSATLASISWNGLYDVMILLIQRGQLIIGAILAQVPTERVLACILL